MASTYPREARERRTLRRSRFGCRNCKLKNSKWCDQGKPHCKRCSSFEVLCNFMGPLVVRGKAELQPPVASAVWTSDESTSYQLNAKFQDFLTRYLGRSLITPDDPNMIHKGRSWHGSEAFVSSAKLTNQLDDRVYWSAALVAVSLTQMGV
ncbi:hypothetical protein BDV29DRAFT_182220 [Aspergillus leporis]|uniref:Zn(2)-C6 fungal-type domain-containing protein n=1 Tax=Aspergillus leporis TaxID=41062 RepID=A0A5N5WRG6_9EURO|nr:hypothetical protein BDV29DRAFT_182220 [Aspergillus leporis]